MCVCFLFTFHVFPNIQPLALKLSERSALNWLSKSSQEFLILDNGIMYEMVRWFSSKKQ